MIPYKKINRINSFLSYLASSKIHLFETLVINKGINKGTIKTKRINTLSRSNRDNPLDPTLQNC